MGRQRRNPQSDLELNLIKESLQMVEVLLIITEPQKRYIFSRTKYKRQRSSLSIFQSSIVNPVHPYSNKSARRRESLPKCDGSGQNTSRTESSETHKNWSFWPKDVDFRLFKLISCLHLPKVYECEILKIITARARWRVNCNTLCICQLL